MRLGKSLLLPSPLGRRTTRRTAVEPNTEANEEASANECTDADTNDGRQWDHRGGTGRAEGFVGGLRGRIGTGRS